MAISLGVKSPVRTHAGGSEEARGPSRVVGGWGDTQDQPASFGLACRDVMDEVRNRMARRGYRWD